MSTKKKYSTGAPWEGVVGYSRAVKSGQIIEVSGTIALDAEGNSLATGESFREIRPATSMVEVSALIRPESMVEIEFTAHLI